MSDEGLPRIDYREAYKDVMARSLEVQRKRREREEAEREDPFEYTVWFTCTPSTWDAIRTVINAHETWDRAFRFHPAKAGQRELPGMDDPP